MRVLAVLLASLFLGSVATLSASDSENQILTTTLHTIEIYEGGSLEEALALSNEWRVKVLDKIPTMASVQYYLRKESDTVYKLNVLYFYKDAESARATGAMIGKVMGEAWPTQEARDAFFRKLNAYIDPKKNVSHTHEVVKRP